MAEFKMEDIVNYCKQYGFIFQGSEIYGGLSNSWDYGPLGKELKENVRKAWWKKFIQEIPNNYGLDSAIIMNPEVWVASGHVTNFNDPLIDCKKCKTRFRADKLIEDFTNGAETGDGWSNEELESYMKENNIVCPHCGSNDFTPIRKFNLLFETTLGVTEDRKSTVYLRGETCQGIFTNFLNVQRSMRAKIPFGIGQTGKSFRNEITPGNFTFRTREFEQMELEFFCKPGTDLDWFGYYKTYCLDFLKSLGLDKEKLRYRDHKKEELAFYSKATTDIEYLYPMGWGELWGIADRTDYDLTQHMEKYTPYVIEPSVGLDRLVLAFLCDSYKKEVLENGTEREVLQINPALAPIKCTILPLVKKDHHDKAMELYAKLCDEFMVSFDESGSIGKRYRRQDAIGTPFCVTIDQNTLDNDIVTVRDRDTMQQTEVKISELKDYIKERIAL